MNIFCKETQAQLELHPHLQNTSLPENLCKSLEPNLPLITPDLWMRDCHSPPPQPLERSVSPIPRQRPHSPHLSGGTPSLTVPQLRVSNKLFDRQTRKRKKTTADDDAAEQPPPPPPPSSTTPVYHPQFPSTHKSVYCSPPLCKSPSFTHPQLSTNNTTASDTPPQPTLYPLNMPTSLLPPPMILVPYPILLPIPIPIPIPIPLPFIQKECESTSNEETGDKKS